MHTRSSGPIVEPSTTPRKRRNKKRSQQQVDPTIVEKPVVTMADTRTMAELLQAPTEGYKDKEDPHAHIRWFNKITSTIKYKDVPNASIKLMLFPFSIEGAARIWLEKEPPRSILTWEDLVSKPVVTKVSTNASTSGLSPDVAALTDAVKALLLKNTTPPPASIKAVEESCVTCGGPHPYYQCLATDGNAFPGYQDIFKHMFLQPQDCECLALAILEHAFILMLSQYWWKLSNPRTDPYSPLPLKDLKCEELKSVKSSVDEPPELKLKDLPPHLEYALLEATY
ncbi:hypothetical protein Tco_0800058 [Tanacetum coccineum]|uniref:Reverse transcriptase domain-containing protein n=1 Tax=Tanacetum coccineum TaxID=301880 RepID=A0ABQ4ZS23_9ASTR